MKVRRKFRTLTMVEEFVMKKLVRVMEIVRVGRPIVGMRKWVLMLMLMVMVMVMVMMMLMVMLMVTIMAVMMVLVVAPSGGGGGACDDIGGDCGGG